MNAKSSSQSSNHSNTFARETNLGGNGNQSGKLAGELTGALPGDLHPLPMTSDDFSQLIPEPDPAVRPSRAQARSKQLKLLWADYQELTKTRIALMVMITAAIGYAFGVPSATATANAESGLVPSLLANHGWLVFIATLIGTGLASMGSGALNQVYERDTDGLMPRTKDRPLPAGRMSIGHAALVGGVLMAAGLGVLAAFTNIWATAACAFTAVTYLGMYTPLKRVTWWSMHLGAIPGAMPPVIGYAAAHNGLGTPAWVLFALMAVWQLPHFLAIAWLYRDDYAKGGLPMLPVIDDEKGTRTFRQTLIGCLLLLPLGALPTIVGMSGYWAMAVGLICGAWFLWLGIRLVKTGTRQAARKLFFASLIYLPLVLAVIMIDRTR